MLTEHNALGHPQRPQKDKMVATLCDPSPAAQYKKGRGSNCTIVAAILTLLTLMADASEFKNSSRPLRPPMVHQLYPLPVWFSSGAGRVWSNCQDGCHGRIEPLPVFVVINRCGHHLHYFDRTQQIPLLPADFPNKMRSAAR